MDNPIEELFFDPYRPATELPPRRFVIDGFCSKGANTGIIAAPGVGKTTFSIAVALAIATGRHDILNMDIIERGKVWFISGEDNKLELERRMRALMKYHAIPPEEVKNQIILQGASPASFAFVNRDKTGRLEESSAVEDLIFEAVDIGVTAIIFDPLVEFHCGDENSNRDMSQIMSVIRKIAQEANTANIVTHHAKKQDVKTSASGNLDAARGASAWGGNIRFAFTLSEMTKTESEGFGVVTNKRYDFMRVVNSKSSFCRLAPASLWFEKSSVELENGDNVGVAAPTTFKRKADQIPKSKEIGLAWIHDYLWGHPKRKASYGDLVSELLQAAESVPELRWVREAYSREKSLMGVMINWFDQTTFIKGNKVVKCQVEGKKGLRLLSSNDDLWQ